MSSARFRLAAAFVLVAALAALLVVQWLIATALRSENAALRRQAAAVAEEARNAVDTAAQQAAERERQRTNQLAELLDLRGEVSRLRRDLAAAQRARATARPPAPKPAQPDAPAPAGPAYTASLAAVMPPGHTLVAGGWECMDGRRGLLLVTPTTTANEAGEQIIELEHRTVLVPDELLDELGLSGLRAREEPASEYRLQTPGDFAGLLAALEKRADAEVLAAPRLTTVSGRQAGLGLTSDDLPHAVTFDVLPTVTVDGQIDLRVEGRFVPAPPGKPAPGGPHPR